MNEAAQRFAIEGAGTTVVHPLGLLILVLCGGLLTFAPKRFAISSLIVLVCFVSDRQCVAIFGLNFYFLRIMVLFFGAARILLKNEFGNFKFCALDFFVIAYGAAYWLSGAINWGFALSVVKMRSGFLVEIIGLYLLLRIVLQTEKDVQEVMRTLSIVVIPLAVFFVIEHLTAKNVFSVFGGVPPETAIRGGRLRCQGAFSHPIIAGVFWAGFFPIVTGEAIRRGWTRFLSIPSVLSLGAIIVLTASSTPVLGLLVGIVAWLCYPLRHLTRPFIACITLTIVVLHFVMKSPVWSLIARINVTQGNSGYHRFLLVDGFINHWHEWFVLGSTIGASHWGHYTFDTANQYVAVGISGGIVTLSAFIGVIICAFLTTERICKSRPLLGWSIGAAILVHCICFFGISVWGQMHLAWSLPLALAGSLQQAIAAEEKLKSQPTSLRLVRVETLT